MCILVHPDKNPSAPAVEAFKVLNMAWEALSSSSNPAPASSGFDWGAPSSSSFSNGRANESNPASGSGFYSGAANTGANARSGGASGTWANAGPSGANARSGGASGPSGANARSGGASGSWVNAGPSGANAQAEPGPYPGCRTSSVRSGGNAGAQSNPRRNTSASDPDTSCPQCSRVCWRRLDSSTSKCAFCNLIMVRDGNNGRFRVVLKTDWGSASIEGSSSMQASNIRVHFSRC